MNGNDMMTKERRQRGDDMQTHKMKLLN